MKLVMIKTTGARHFCVKCDECRKIFRLSAVYYVSGTRSQTYVCTACAFLQRYITLPIVTDEVIS